MILINSALHWKSIVWRCTRITETMLSQCDEWLTFWSETW
jgi:hypothetical protein